MKPLLLILLISLSVEAQSIPDIARQQRERRAANKNVHVLTTEDAQSPVPPTTIPATTTVAPKSPAVPAPPVPAGPAEDPRKKYAEDLAKIKAKVVQLQDQDTAVQLQINTLKNAFLAPVIDQAAQAQAQAKLAEAQDQLAVVQKDLADAKKAALELEAQGPPKP